MKNLDMLQLKKAEIANKLNQAMKDGNEEVFQQAFTEYTDMLQEAVMAEARGMVQAADNTILTGRGARVLTSQETKYYEGLIEAMKSKNPQQALTLIDEALPKTVIDAIFEDIVESHPLLNAINFQDTGILVEILVSTQDGRHMATWSKLCDDIVTELTAGLDVIKLDQKKLSAFIPICKAMLEIGPVWIDRYVRTILGEAIANGLEEAIIDGNGLDEPIGMRRNPAGALDQITGYPLLVPVPLAEITPATYGGIIASLATGSNGLTRTVTEVLFIVNPVDYFTKLMPATTFLVNGTWVNNVFPFPTRVIQSVHCPQDEAIIGLGKRYFFGLGTGKGGKIEYSDHYRFLEDERVYLTKLYGNGKPLDAVSFKRIDISGLKPYYPIVRATPYIDARLASLTVAAGAIDISPAFSPDIHYYTAETDNAGDVVAATAIDSDNAVVTATLNGSPATLGTPLTWAEGQNVVVITVTNGDYVETYVLVVTLIDEA
jgi:hypothetical protein